MTRYYVDTEFADTGSTIELISIGIVCECGKEYYAQASGFLLGFATPWIKEHVWLHLERCSLIDTVEKNIGNVLWTQMTDHKFLGGRCASTECPWRTREQIRDDLLDFFNPSDPIELWAHCGSYDYVVLCQIFGTLMDLPSFFPHYIHDFQQILDDRGITDEELPLQKGSGHHALNDAKHLAKLWGYVVRNDAWQ